MLRGRPILLITRMITDQIGLHSVLLPLSIEQSINQSIEPGRLVSIEVSAECH